MTTTKIIEFLKKYEIGASGRPREVSFYIDGNFISEPDITFVSSADGCAGAELSLKIERRFLPK